MTPAQQIVLALELAARAAGGELLELHPTASKPTERVLAKTHVLLIDDTASADGADFGQEWLLQLVESYDSASQVWTGYPVAEHLLSIAAYCGLNKHLRHVIVITTELRAPFWEALTHPEVVVCQPHGDQTPGEVVPREPAVLHS